jgi:hypothetical protein
VSPEELAEYGEPLDVVLPQVEPVPPDDDDVLDVVERELPEPNDEPPEEVEPER